VFEQDVDTLELRSATISSAPGPPPEIILNRGLPSTETGHVATGVELEPVAPKSNIGAVLASAAAASAVEKGLLAQGLMRLNKPNAGAATATAVTGAATTNSGADAEVRRSLL
jgi:hypothetical protein